MKIVYLITSSVYGGAPQHLLELASGMNRKGHECLIVCPQGEMVSEYQKKHIRVIVLEPKFDIDLFFIFRLRKILLQEKADILHTHLLKATINGLLAGFLAQTRVRISHIHGTLFDWEIPKWKRNLNIFVNAFVTNLFAHRVIALTNQIKKDLIQNDRIKKEKIIVVLNGLDPKKYTEIPKNNFLFQKYHWPQKQIKIIGMLGRFSIERGQNCLIETAAILINKFRRQDLRFVLIGEGADKKELEQKVKNLKLDSYIKFTGFLDENMKNQALQNLIIFVSPALREGFGLSVLEAMFIGLPLVVSNIATYKELCPEGECSLFAEKENPESFAQAILTLLNDSKLSQRLVQNALLKASRNFSLEKFLDNYHNLYQDKENHVLRIGGGVGEFQIIFRRKRKR